MIKFCLLAFCCVLTSLSTQAQWWKKTRIERFALIKEAKCIVPDYYGALKLSALTKTLAPVIVGRSQYSYDINEAAVMKALRHSLRYHITADAFIGFNNLVVLYLDQSRYSEAKWYLLQYNNMGRQHNDNKAIVFSLIALGMLKADIGDFAQARQDLLEARDICTSQGLLSDLTNIAKKLDQVEYKRVLNVKNDIRYAVVAEGKD